MLGNRLNRLRETVESWCKNKNIYTSSVCDMAGVQGIKIYERDRKTLRGLFEDLTPILRTDNIFLDIQKVRGGLIFAFSMKALAESDWRSLLNHFAETREIMSFKERIADAFSREVTTVASEPDFDSLALQIAEEQYKVASSGLSRSNSQGHERNRHNGKLANGKNKKKATFEHTIKQIFDDSTQSVVKRPFHQQLHEALDGMATPDGAQPGDLFSKFARSLAVLGQQMGIGPLQDQLKKQGINWKKSDDGQAIILYIQNASTNAPQPIARIGAETLSKPNEFQEQLLHMIDFSKGEAPGAFQQQKDAIQAQEKAVREIANTLNPSDQSIMQQMANGTGQPAAMGAAPNAGAVGPTGPAAPAPQPQQPQPTPQPQRQSVQPPAPQPKPQQSQPMA